MTKNNIIANSIWITTDKEFIHKFPGAPKEVSFLKNEHRHSFKFKVWIEVNHNDRDIEFFIFKRFINQQLNELPYVLGRMSCEMLSDYLEKKIRDKYPNRFIAIEVSEDGENGSFKIYPKS